MFFNLVVATEEEKASPGQRAEAGKAHNPRDHLSHPPDSNLVPRVLSYPSLRETGRRENLGTRLAR